MNSPKTYSEWVNLLDIFVSGDDNCLEILEKGELIIDAGTAYRFYTRIEEVYRKRKLKWLESFQKTFEYSGIKKIEEFEIALRNAKKNLVPLFRFINLSAFPQDLADTLNKDLKDFVAEIKNNLKKNLAQLSANKERMNIIIASFDIPSVSKSDTTSISSPAVDNNIQSSSGRKIIF